MALCRAVFGVSQSLWRFNAMVRGGSWWFLVVRGGLMSWSWWFVVVHSGSWWFVVVCGGLWWFVVD